MRYVTEMKMMQNTSFDANNKKTAVNDMSFYL